VHNLLSAVGAAPHFARPNFPAPTHHYPPGVNLTLVPFGEPALRHFIFLERPEGMELKGAAGIDAPVEGAVPLMAEGDIVPQLQDFATVGHLYRSIEHGIARLAERFGDRLPDPASGSGLGAAGGAPPRRGRLLPAAAGRRRRAARDNARPDRRCARRDRRFARRPLRQVGAVSRFGRPEERPPKPPPDQAADAKIEQPDPDEPINFDKQIKPLFRSRDQQSMRFAFDLWSYDDVKANTQTILERLDNGTMPCDAPWPLEQITAFKRWLQSGMSP
jgi:hypothetical protein